MTRVGVARVVYRRTNAKFKPTGPHRHRYLSGRFRPNSGPGWMFGHCRRNLKWPGTRPYVVSGSDHSVTLTVILRFLCHWVRLIYVCGTPVVKWRHFAPGLEIGRSGRGQPFGLTRPAGRRKSNAPIDCPLYLQTLQFGPMNSFLQRQAGRETPGNMDLR